MRNSTGALQKSHAKDGSQGRNNSFINSNNQKSNTIKAHNANKIDNNSNSNSQRVLKCYLCNDKHFISYCNSFKEKTPTERYNFVQTSKFCINCLGKHLLKDCKIKKTCSKCNERHHTFIHEFMCKDVEKQQHTTPETSMVETSVVSFSLNTTRVFSMSSLHKLLRSRLYF